MPQIIDSQEWLELSDEERKSIENFPLYGYAVLAGVFTDYSKLEDGCKITWYDFLGCLGAAFGMENIGWNLLKYGSGRALTRGIIVAVLKGIAASLGPVVGAIMVAVTIASVYACLRAIENSYVVPIYDNNDETDKSEIITVSTDVNRLAYPNGAILVY